MNKSILIVEDEVILQELYELVLEAKGYVVYTANDGAEGLKQLAATKPDMVLLDVLMPVLDGKDFLRSINTNDYKNTKIVVYSNLSDRETEAEMLRLGACRFVLKSSMTTQDLIALVEEVTDNDLTSATEV